MKLGVISDTHGHLDPKIFSLFSGVDEILHAGDIGKIEILYDLRAIAPTYAVYGNCDGWDIRNEVPQALVRRLPGINIGLCHGAGSYHNIPERMVQLFEEEDVSIIVHGHTHIPTQEEFEGVFIFNPGDGRKTVGFIEIDETGTFTTRIVEIARHGNAV